MNKPSLSSIRAEIASKQAELAWIEAAGGPIVDNLLSMKLQLDDLAAPYRKAINLLALQIIGARSPCEIKLHEVLNLTYQPAEFALAAAAALLQDRIAGDLQVEIDKLAPSAPPALEDEEQRQALARLRSDLLGLERSEELLIVGESEHGSTVERRADADPRAVLEIPDGICAEFNL